jgi:hypothetical protein
MNARGITVFVKKSRGVFHASTLQAEAIDTWASVAARRCAALHLGVAEEEIELTPNGEHTVIAHVREPARLTRWPLRVALAIAAATALACTALALIGGGQ